MAGKTYKTSGIVLRKTKLGEKDLIVTLLDETGALKRAVAKGARKPGGSYAARLELFSSVDIMCAQGRNLDVITSARLADGAALRSLGIEQSSCASVLAELLATLAQEELPQPRLYAMSKSAFETIAQSDAAPALSVATSAILKALAYAGFRPSFTNCISCGDEINLVGFEAVAFSTVEGGVLCTSCQHPSDSVRVSANTLRWADVLMKARFADVIAFDAPTDVLFEILQNIRQWTKVHVGKSLKSLDFLFTCGLF